MYLAAGPTAAIALNGNLSGAIDVGDGGLMALQLSSTWVTASITFQASSDLNGTYVEAVDSNATAISISSIAASQYIALNAAVFAGMRYIKIRSGTAGSPVTQTTAQNIKTMVRLLG